MNPRIPFHCMALVGVFVALMLPHAIQASEDDASDPAKEKPKEPPFKFSAWCAFRDLNFNLSSMASVKNNPLSEEARLGTSNWIGFGRRGQWATLVLELKNTTEDTDYAGTATVTLAPLKENDAGQPPYRNTYKINFKVGRQSTEQYRLSVRCPENAWTEPVKITFSASGGAGGTRFVQLRDLEGKDFIVVVSESAGAFRHIASRSKNSTEDEFEDTSEKKNSLRDVAVIDPKEFPSRWHDLMLANLIILDDPTHEKFNDAQWDALKSYVKAGGHILITAGKDPARLRGPLEDLAGISVRGMVTIPSLDSFTEYSVPKRPTVPQKNPDGTEVENTEPVAAWTLPLVDTHVVASTHSASIPQYNKKTGFLEQCRRYYGSGSVTFLPFSLSDKLLENWSGRTDIPLQLLELGRGRKIFGLDHPDVDPLRFQNTTISRQYPYTKTEPALTTETLDGLRIALDESFAKDTPVEMQKPATVMSFLLLYLLCAVPLNYFIFGWFKRREVAWLAIPIWALSFSIMAYMFGYMGKTGKLTINEVTIVEVGSGQEIGIARTFVGLYAPLRDNYRLNFSGNNDFDVQAAPSHLINLSFAESRNVDLPQMEMLDDDAGLHVENLLVLQRATRRLEVLHRVTMKGGLEVLVKENPDRPNVFSTLTVTNNTGYDLNYPVLISQGKAIEICPKDTITLRTGDSLNLKNVGAPEGLPWADANAAFFGRKIIFRGVRGPHAAKRIEALAAYVRKRLDGFQGDVLCAYIEGPMLPIEVGAGAKGAMEKPGTFEGITLLLSPITIKKQTRSPQNATTPKQFAIRYSLDFDPRTQTGEWMERPSDDVIPMATTDTSNSVDLELEVPSDYRDLLENRMLLTLNGRLEVAPTKKVSGKTIPQTVPNFNGNIKFEILRTLDSGSTRWEELSTAILTGLDNVTPFKLPQIKLPLDDHRLRTSNLIHLRMTVTYAGKKRLLQLHRLTLKSARKD